MRFLFDRESTSDEAFESCLRAAQILPVIFLSFHIIHII